MAKGNEEKKITANLSKDLPKTCTRMFVKNLPFSANENQIKKLFEDCGQVKEVRIVTNKEPTSKERTSKGFAYVDFLDHESLQQPSQFAACTLWNNFQPSYERLLLIRIHPRPASRTY